MQIQGSVFKKIRLMMQLLVFYVSSVIYDSYKYSFLRNKLQSKSLVQKIKMQLKYQIQGKLTYINYLYVFINNFIKMNKTKFHLIDNPQGNGKMQMLLQQFNTLDRKRQGSIKLSEAIKLVKQQTSVQAFDEDIIPRMIFNQENQVTFDQFLAMLYEVQIDNNIHNHLVNQNMVEFLKLLEDYRKKRQQDSNYLEAEKAYQKIIQIKNKEMKRHKQKLLFQQKYKVSSVNSLQQSKIMQFNHAWNDYMSKYQQAAIGSIQKLKAKHLRQIQQQQERIRTYYENYLKPSKKLIDLRSKQKHLVKQKQYQQAQRLKQYANKLASQQRQIKTQQINQRIKKRKQTLQKHQEIALLAHLKRIEKDRNEQMKQRQNDSSKMLFKLKNLQNDMVQKQSVQIRQTLDHLRETMSLTSSQLFSPKMRSLGKLQKVKEQIFNEKGRQSLAKAGNVKKLNDLLQKGKTIEQTQIKNQKQKVNRSFKIRVNSFHRTKVDHSMYDP